MSPRLAALVVVVCSLPLGIFGVQIAHADRRPVAIVNLTDSEAGMELSRALGKELIAHPKLQLVADAPIAAELMAKLGRDEDARRLGEAKDSMRAAAQQLDRFEFKSAEGTVIAAQESLLSASPSPPVIAAYAELAFLLGHAYLGLREPKQAAAAFALAHRVDPAFVPDEGYLPEVIRAYEAHKGGLHAAAKISVTGTGTVVIDGKAVGEAQGARVVFDVNAGDHVVWLVGAEREPRGRRVSVAANRKEEVAIADAVRTTRNKVQQVRLALEAAPDAAARASTVRELAALVGVGDMVLVTEVNAKLIVQTWRDKDGFSALRERKTEPVAELLYTIEPPPPAPPRPPRDDGKPVVVEERWYEQNRYRIGIPAAVAVIVGIFVIASIDRHVTNDPMPGFVVRR